MRPNGFTLIEFLVVIAVLAMLATMAAPSYTDQMARRRLEGAGTELATDLQFARAQAVSRRGSTTLVTDAGGTSYQVTTGDGIKTVTLPNSVTVTASTTVTYDYLRGMADADHVLSLSSTRTAGTMNVVVSGVGRVKICSPDGLMGVVSC
jgi:prepilin-type N-terminal cleavage/methylation domain-containing protein